LQIKPDEHLFYFTAATLTALLGKTGLDVRAIEPFDRYHNLTTMGHSTTLRGPFRALASCFDLIHRLVGDVVVRLPLRENLLAIAVKRNA
jgi:hypothetical protein